MEQKKFIINKMVQNGCLQHNDWHASVLRTFVLQQEKNYILFLFKKVIIFALSLIFVAYIKQYCNGFLDHLSLLYYIWRVLKSGKRIFAILFSPFLFVLRKLGLNNYSFAERKVRT